MMPYTYKGQQSTTQIGNVNDTQVPRVAALNSIMNLCPISHTSFDSW